MTEGFNWAPRRVRLRSRVALGVAVIRVWVGLVVLAAGVALAVLHFQAPHETAAIEQILLAHESDEASSTSSIARGAGGAAASTLGGRADAGSGPWEHRSIIVGRRDIRAGGIETGQESLSGSELVRALQSELQRVGCYRGEIDGAWGPMSRKAMTGFTDRVNASLPVNKPDPVLYRLVQAYEGQACGSCPSGEKLSGEGRCVPAAVLARDGETSEDGVGQYRAAEPLPGRMSIGGPLADGNAGESLTRQGAEQPRSRSRRSARRPRFADRNAPPPSYRTPSTRKHWTETIFDEISRR